MNNSQTIEYRNEQNREKRDNMKYFILCILICIGVNTCILKQNAGNKHTISIPQEIYDYPFDYSKKWEDYSTDIKPYNVLDMTNKSVSKINQLYGEPIFNETNTICFGKIRYSSVDTTYYYHNEPDIAYMFRGTPKIPLYQMWWKMNRDNITYILVLYCIDKDGDKYPVYGYAYDESKPLPE